MADTFNKVVEIISERLGKDASTITENSKFREDLGADVKMGMRVMEPSLPI